MGVLEAVSKIVQLGGAPAHAAAVGARRATFEERTGAFTAEDAWYEERIRAFWLDAVTSGGLGREVSGALADDERAWLPGLARAHRGLFRCDTSRDVDVLVDLWSGAELEVNVLDDASREELHASAGQVFDGRVVGHDDPWTVALLPGAVFHPLDATPCIEPLLVAARAREMSGGDTLDALLRMQRALRSLSRVKVAYAYRAEALSPRAPVLPHAGVRRAAKDPR